MSLFIRFQKIFVRVLPDPYHLFSNSPEQSFPEASISSPGLFSNYLYGVSRVFSDFFRNLYGFSYQDYALLSKERIAFVLPNLIHMFNIGQGFDVPPLSFYTVWRHASCNSTASHLLSPFPQDLKINFQLSKVL